MSVRERIEDAKALWDLGRKEGAFVQILIAAAATARKRYPKPPKGTKAVPEGQRPRPGEYATDSASFKTFILDEMGEITGGPKYGVAIPFAGRDKVPLEDIMYSHLRCHMVHEGETPPSITFTEEAEVDGKPCAVLRLTAPLGLPEGWMWNLARAVAKAPENRPLFDDYDINKPRNRGEPEAPPACAATGLAGGDHGIEAKDLPMETCLMCGQRGPIRESHIIPDWYYRDEIRDLAHGGRFHDLRRMRTHGRAITMPLMCGDCEQLVGRLDNEAKKYNQARPEAYGEWMLPFAASISWRVLHYYRLEPGMREHHAALLAEPAVEEALGCWKDTVLHGKTTRRTRRHTLHLYHVHEGYAMRQMICTAFDRLADGGGSLVVFSRFGSFAFIGVVHSRDAEYWQGSRSRLLKPGGEITPYNAASPDVIRFLVEVERECARRVAAFNQARGAAPVGGPP